jgi:hypothetical protein
MFATSKIQQQHECTNDLKHHVGAMFVNYSNQVYHQELKCDYASNQEFVSL